MLYTLAHGVKLFERCCASKKCTASFKVPKSCPQMFCSQYCKQDGSVKFDNEVHKPKKSKKKKTFSYHLTKEDYE